MRRNTHAACFIFSDHNIQELQWKAEKKKTKQILVNKHIKKVYIKWLTRLKRILFFSFIKFTLWTLLNLHFVNNSRGVRIRDFFDALHLKDKKRFLFTICDGENRTAQQKREEWNGLILTLLLFILSLWMKWYLECLMLNWKFLHLVLITSSMIIVQYYW